MFMFMLFLDEIFKKCHQMKNQSTDQELVCRVQRSAESRNIGMWICRYCDNSDWEEIKERLQKQFHYKRSISHKENKICQKKNCKVHEQKRSI